MYSEWVSRLDQDEELIPYTYSTYSQDEELIQEFLVLVEELIAYTYAT